MWERSVDQLFRDAPTQRSTNPPVEIFVSACDSMLHRELGHRQIISERRCYEVCRIGWVEVIGQAGAWDGAAIQAAIEKRSLSNTKSGERVTPAANPEALGLGDDVAMMRALSIRQSFAEAMLLRDAKQMRDASPRGENLGLNDDELAFYDALAVNDSAVQIIGIDELKVLAAELVTSVRRSATVDWTVRESARAQIRVIVRRILRKYGYPPDLQAEATRLVLEQAEVLCADWAGHFA